MPASGPGKLRWRLIFAILGCIGMSIIYGLKVNLHANIVAMVNNTALKLKASEKHGNVSNDGSATVSDESHGTSEHNYTICYGIGSPGYDPVAAAKEEKAKGAKQGPQDGPFVWDSYVQGIVLGAYFYGYLVTQVPGGRLAEVVSGKWVFFVAVLMHLIPTLLSPIMSEIHWGALVAMRIIEGLGGGATLPAMNVLISKWAPKNERSLISSLCYGGMAIGTVLSISSTGFIAGSLGWAAVFYIHGGLSIIWCILWTIFVTDNPADHRFISDEEKIFIAATSTSGGKKGPAPPLPIKKIFTSIPFWAIFLSHFLQNFGWYMLLVEIPTFLNVGLGYDIEANALLSSLPFLCNWIFSILYSSSLDFARSKGWINTTWARKLSTAIASIIPGACLIGVCLAGCDSTVVVILLIVATCAFGSIFSGILSNHVDIASNYAGVLMGFTNMFATIPGCIVPIIVAGLTHGTHGLEPWHVVFYLTAGLLFLETIVFTLMASGVEQSWNKRPNEEVDDDDEEATARLNDLRRFSMG